MFSGTRRVQRWVEDLRQDVRFGLRTLTTHPGFAAVVVLTLAIGIGANTAVVSLVEAALLRELPVEDAQQLVFVRTAGNGRGGAAPPYPYFNRLRRDVPSFGAMAAFAADELRVEVDGTVEQVFGQVASGNYFSVLGLTPAAGRLMTAEDERLDPPVAVIGFGYWQRRFGGAPDAIGRTLSFRDRVFTIVGVTPARFQGLEPGRQVDVTLPITLESGMVANADAQWFNAVARIPPGLSLQPAAAQASAGFQSFMSDRDPSGRWRARFDRLELVPASRGLDRLRARFSDPLYTLTLVTGILLVIACVNLGGLLLIHGTARAREFAVRLATGASSGRLLRQVLTETLLLFTIGAGMGLMVAYAAIQALTEFFAAGRRPILLDVQFDWRLLAYAATVTLTAGLFTGLWPAARALRTEPHDAMKGNGARLAGARRLGAKRALVAGQVALSLTLLVAAALFARTMVNLRAADLGFRPSGVLTMSLDPELPRDTTAAAREQLWTRVLDHVRGLPGVRSASLSVLTPLSGRNTGVGIGIPGGSSRAEIRLNHVSDDYFRTFGIELIAGRTFTRQDSGGLNVVILNETAARAALGGRFPIGQQVALGDAGVYQVVGLVRDHKHLSVREQAPPFAFVPLWQPINPIARLTLSLSSVEPRSRLAGAVAHEVRSVHSDTLVSDVIAVTEQIDETLVTERLLSTLASWFAVLVLCLAAIGLYGLVSFSVAGRRHELGVRIALGAPRSRVAIGVIREALLPVVTGIAVGLPVALTIARAAERLLFQVTSADATNYLFGAGAMLLVGFAAAWLPARRACLIDPADTLRRG